MGLTHTRSGRWIGVLALLLCVSACGPGSPIDAQAESDADALPRLGLVVDKVSDDALHERGLQYAVEIAEIAPGSPAERSGLQPGDLIFQLNDVPVYSVERLVWLVNHASADQPLRLRVLRDDERQSYDVERLLPADLPAHDSGAERAP
jgi:membrane-associated protease RseP (regulator of RpoE activity)